LPELPAMRPPSQLPCCTLRLRWRSRRRRGTGRGRLSAWMRRPPTNPMSRRQGRIWLSGSVRPVATMRPPHPCCRHASLPRPLRGRRRSPDHPRRRPASPRRADRAPGIEA